VLNYKYLENRPGVYLIRNLINKKVYVGSSENIRKRLIQHTSDLNLKIHHSKILQRSIEKHGVSNFKVSVLEYTCKSDILARERYWLNFYSSYNPIYGYNICKFPGNTKGRKHSEESKLKMSNNRKGLTSGTKNPFFGKKHDLNFIKRMSEERKIAFVGTNNPNYNKNIKNEDLLLSYKKLKSFKKVGEKFNVHKSTVERRLKSLNINLKAYKNDKQSKNN